MAFPQIIAAFLTIFEAIGLSGNLLVIMTIVVRKNFHVMRYILLASLSVSDVLFLIIVNSFRIASIAQERWLYGKTMCRLNPLFVRYFYINTVLHLMAVSYDRYDSIVKSPLTYNGRFTKSKVAALVLIWLIPIGFLIGIFFYGAEYANDPEVFFFCQEGITSQSVPSGLRIAIIITLFVVPLVVIALLNWSVYKTAKRQANAVAIQIGSFDGSESQQQDNSRQRITERKAALDVSLIIAAFLLCFLPTFIVGLYVRFFKSTNVPSEAVLVTYCIFMFSSVCNPIIYSIRKRDFRRAVKEMVLRKRILPHGNQTTDIYNRMAPMSSVNHDTVAPTSTSVVVLANQLQDERLPEGTSRPGVPVQHYEQQLNS